MSRQRNLKHSAFGWIPNAWHVKSLDEVCELIQDGTHFSPKTKTGPYKYLTSRNVREGRLDLSNVSYISESEHRSIYSRCPVKKGDILLTKDGAKAGAAAPNTIDEEFSLLSSVALLRGKQSQISNEFLLQVLMSEFAQMQIRRAVTGQAITRLTLETIKLLLTVVPSIKEQKSIAEIAMCHDLQKRCLESLLSKKVKRKLALMQQLLTGKVRFKEFVKSYASVQTHFGQFPMDWPVVYVGDIAEEINKKNRDNAVLPVLSCSKHHGLVNSLEYFGKRIYSEDTSGYKVVGRGDFAYATNHIEEGSIGYQNLHDRALISPMYTVFRTRAGVDHSFLFKLVKTELYRHIFEANTNGSINRRGALRWDDFSRIKIHLPCEPEQRRIASVLDICDREIELLQKQLKALKEQKRGLIRKLLTGEIRVKAKA